MSKLKNLLKSVSQNKESEEVHLDFAVPSTKPPEAAKKPVQKPFPKQDHRARAEIKTAERHIPDPDENNDDPKLFFRSVPEAFKKMVSVARLAKGEEKKAPVGRIGSVGIPTTDHFIHRPRVVGRTGDTIYYGHNSASPEVSPVKPNAPEAPRDRKALSAKEKPHPMAYVRTVNTPNGPAHAQWVMRDSKRQEIPLSEPVPHEHFFGKSLEKAEVIPISFGSRKEQPPSKGEKLAQRVEKIPHSDKAKEKLLATLKAKPLQKSPGLKQGSKLGHDIYDETANIGRKMTRTGAEAVGAGIRATQEYGGKAGHMTAKDTARKQEAIDRSKNKKQPVRQASPEEIAKMNEHIRTMQSKTTKTD